MNQALYFYIMLSQPGTYALVFSACHKHQPEIGKLGIFDLKPGFYIYIGSAVCAVIGLFLVIKK